ncbi:hypothetical protein BJX76DRAFT_356644 [Aspergillus varians]
MPSGSKAWTLAWDPPSGLSQWPVMNHDGPLEAIRTSKGLSAIGECESHLIRGRTGELFFPRFFPRFFPWDGFKQPPVTLSQLIDFSSQPIILMLMGIDLYQELLASVRTFNPRSSQSNTDTPGPPSAANHAPTAMDVVYAIVSPQTLIYGENLL